MKTIPLIFLTVFLGITVTLIMLKASGSNKKTACTNTTSNRSAGFSVVELFTSEGCSSCPPADKVLATIKEAYANDPVFILSYHVDYWDRLGWKDVFSKPAFSARQYQYVQWLNLSSAYTPQVVVNGVKEFVGSQESMLRNIITNDLKNKTVVQLELKTMKVTDDQIKIMYNTGVMDSNISLVLNLVKRTATTKVVRGENKGRDLPHVQIVMEQQKIINNSGTVFFNIPPATTAKDFEVIGFMQNNTTGEITGAAKSFIN